MTITDIQEAVAEHFKLPVSEMRSRNWVQPAPWARQVGMYLARECIASTFQNIGREFGGRTHATVIHGIRHVANRVDVHPGTRSAVAAIKQALQSRTN